MELLLNQLQKNLVEQGNRIIENDQYTQNFKQEVLEEFIQLKKAQGITIEIFKEAQAKTMGISRWNIVLAIFNFLLVSGGLIFILMDFKVKF